MMSTNQHINKLLILDLDETLIYSSEVPLDRCYDFRVGQYFVYRRPGLTNFLLECSAIFRIAVWTASSSDYVREILAATLPDNFELEFIFTRERCTFRFNHETGRQEIIKSLKKVKRRGYSLRDMIIIDDLPETFSQNYGNAILVKRYFGDLEDTELSLLFQYLTNFLGVDDVRKINKRNWRNSMNASGGFLHNPSKRYIPQ
jgi:carboxy-terminal domain RNA polymerase II polypeptide A small phosphatase